MRKIKQWFNRHEDKLFSIACVLTVIVWIIWLLQKIFYYYG